MASASSSTTIDTEKLAEKMEADIKKVATKHANAAKIVTAEIKTMFESILAAKKNPDHLAINKMMDTAVRVIAAFQREYPKDYTVEAWFKTAAEDFYTKRPEFEDSAYYASFFATAERMVTYRVHEINEYGKNLNDLREICATTVNYKSLLQSLREHYKRVDKAIWIGEAEEQITKWKTQYKEEETDDLRKKRNEKREEYATHLIGELKKELKKKD